VSSHPFAHAPHRRSKRIERAVPIVVHGVGAMREPYQEQVSTVSISCHGCSYQSRHEVLQGETVYLDVQPSTDGAVGCSTRAQVKWVQKLQVKERAFQIAVELEFAGNIWGVATPPDDWFPLRIPAAVEPAATGRELKVVTRKEQQAVHAAAPAASPGGGSIHASQTIPRTGAAAPAALPLAQLMAGLGEQIQSMASEAAAAALARDKVGLLEEIRAHLRQEAVKTIQSVIAASKDVIVQQATKELSEAHEASIRNSHAQWRKQIQQDMESARQHMLAQGNEMALRLDSLAASTVERLQTKIDATRSEAVDRFITRIREQVAPMLEVAKDSLQRLEGAESALRKESQAIFAGIENQLAFSTNESLAKALEDLERNTAGHTAKTHESLQKLYQSFEKAARDNAESLLASLGDQTTAILQQKAAEVSQEFSAGLEGHARNYLESVAKSIAEIPRNVPGRSGQ
jgi:hypothetical protein